MGMHLYFFWIVQNLFCGIDLAAIPVDYSPIDLQDMNSVIGRKNLDVRKRSHLKGLLQSMGKENKEIQIRFKMQKDGGPVWDQATDRLWVTREATIESGPPPAETGPATNSPAKNIIEPARRPLRPKLFMMGCIAE
jgi:hypothetical protein